MADSSDSAASEASSDTDAAGVTGAGGRADPGVPPEQPGSGQQSPYAAPSPGQAGYAPSPYGQPPYGRAPDGSGYPTSPYGGSPYGQWVPPAPKPGIIPLRPLSVGEILDGAFTAIRRNPLAILGFAAIVMTVYGIASTGTSLALNHLVTGVAAPAAGQPLTSANTAYIVKVELPELAVSFIIQFLATTLLTGMLASVLGHSVLGRQIGMPEAWQLTRARLGALFGATMLSWLIVFGTVIGGSLLSVLAWAVLSAAHLAPLGVLLMVLAIPTSVVFGVIFFVRLAASPGAVMLERQAPVASLRRSWRLVRKSSWRVFGILLLAELIVVVAAAVLAVPFSVIGTLVGGHGSGSLFIVGADSRSTPIVAAIVAGIGTIVAGTITRPVLAGAQVLLYVDLRMRREGLDIALQSAAGDGPGQAAPEFGAVWDVTPPASTTTLGPPEPPGDAAAPPDQQRW